MEASDAIVPQAHDPARVRANAFLGRHDVKSRVIKSIENHYASPAERVERAPFTEFAAAAVEAAVEIDGIVGRDDLADAASHLFQSKLDGLNVRETISFFRHGYAAAARKPKPLGLPRSYSTGPLLSIAKVYEDRGLGPLNTPSSGSSSTPHRARASVKLKSTSSMGQSGSHQHHPSLDAAMDDGDDDDNDRGVLLAAAGTKGRKGRVVKVSTSLPQLVPPAPPPPAVLPHRPSLKLNRGQKQGEGLLTPLGAGIIMAERSQKMRDARDPTKNPWYREWADWPVGTTGKPVQDLLRDKLCNLGARVIDLLRDWDTDGDGFVTLVEFRAALRKYGCPASHADIDAVYANWDKDHSGSLSLIELFRVLRQGGTIKLPKQLKRDPITQEEIREQAEELRQGAGLNASPRGVLQTRLAFGRGHTRRIHVVASEESGGGGGGGGGSASSGGGGADGGGPGLAGGRRREAVRLEATTPAETEHLAAVDDVDEEKEMAIEKADEIARESRLRTRNLFMQAVQRPGGAAAAAGEAHAAASASGDGAGSKTTIAAVSLVRAFAFAHRSDTGEVRVQLRLQARKQQQQQKQRRGGQKAQPLPEKPHPLRKKGTGVLNSSMGKMAASASMKQAMGADLIEAVTYMAGGAGGTVNRAVFGEALQSLGVDSKMRKKDVDNLFASLDRNGAGQLQLEELIMAIKFMIDPSMKIDRQYKGMVRALNQLIEDAGVEKNPISMLRDALTNQASRVIELFQRWDEDGNGLISREEFRRGAYELGFVNSLPDEIDRLFTVFDTDKSGSISFQELHAMLRHKFGQSSSGAGGEPAAPSATPLDVSRLRLEIRQNVLEMSIRAELQNATVDEEWAAILDQPQEEEQEDEEGGEQAKKKSDSLLKPPKKPAFGTLPPGSMDGWAAKLESGADEQAPETAAGS